MWLRQQGAKGRERLLANAKVGPAAALLSLDQARLEKHLEVVADGRLAQTERLGEVADAGFVVGLRLDQAEQSQARGICDHLQPRGELLGVRGVERFLQERRA